MSKVRSICTVGLAIGLLAALAGPAGAAKEPYPLKKAKRFVVQGERVAGAASRGENRCRIPRATLSLAPHERAVELRELSVNQRTCRVRYERGIPPRSAEGSQRGGAGASVQAAGRRFRYSGYAEAWYWDRRDRKVINSVRTGASWDGGRCIGSSNVFLRKFKDTATGWFELKSRARWSYVQNRCDYLLSSARARFRDRRFSGCSDGPVVDALYTRVRYVADPNGGQKASRSGRVEPSCPGRLSASFGLYRG